MTIQRWKLDRVDRRLISLKMVYWHFGISGIPEYNLSLVIATGEDAVMKLVIADILNLFFMVVEVTKRIDSVVFLFGRDVPKREFSIVTACNNMTMFIRIPFKRKSFCLMTCQNDGWVDFNSSCFESGLIEDVHLSTRSTSCYKVGLFWMMFDFIYLSFMFNFMVNNYHIFHRTVVFLYCFVCFYRS